MTLLLTRSEVEPLLHLAALLPQMRQALRSYSLERSIPAQRVRSALPDNPLSSATLLFPGLLPGIPAYTVKVHAKFPDQEPAIQGVLLLHDLATGRLLAIMDSTAITAVRTGLAGAVAADVLARPEASRVAIIGAGIQGVLQLRCLALVRALSQVWIYDAMPAKAKIVAEQMQAELSIPVQAVSALSDAVQQAEIIVAATWSRTPFLFPHMVQPGTHITTLGPDEPGKAEVAADLIQQGLFVCDDRDLAITMGALQGVGLGSEAIHAELGEIVGGVRPGRTNDEQITIYGGVGLAFQDLVACWHVYQQAMGVERKIIDFFS